jgi:hypothetical protein
MPAPHPPGPPALSCTPGGRRRLAGGANVFASSAPGAYARARPAGGRNIFADRRAARGLRYKGSGRRSASRLEGARSETQRRLGSRLSRRRRQSHRSDRARTAIAGRGLRRRHDGLPCPRRERRNDGHLWLARTPGYPGDHRRAGSHGTSATLVRSGRINGRGYRPAIRRDRAAHRSGRRRGLLLQLAGSFL